MMRMGRKEEKRSLLKYLVLASSLVLATGVWAQDADDEEEDAVEDVVELEPVIVTGSRLQRATYSSIAPLQIITAQGSREAGLIDAADILQQSTAAAGQQIDLTFSAFVLDNGPGASTISLRGLGSARTLVLMNGRRLAPSGVEGAPAAPDLNLVPASLVRQYDVLLDGASSVYGSDAVAGVVNILLRQDFDGLEIDIYSNIPDQNNGESYTVNTVWGKNFDRGFIGVGVEYVDNDAVTLADRRFSAGCERHREIDQNGVIRTQEQFYTTVYGMKWDDCRIGLLAARVSVFGAGSIYHTPGVSNGGWPGFSESSTFGFGIDSSGDGVADLSFRDYSLNGKAQFASLFPANDRLSVMSYGEYTFEGEMNNTFFYEVNYNDRNFFSDFGQPQLFPSVPANNPFSICNPDGIRGVDCGLALDALYTSPAYVAQFGANFEDLCASFGFGLADCTPGLFGLLNGPVGATSTQPIVAVRGDRGTTRVNGDQIRAVIGLKGDTPFNWGPMDDWIYETYYSWTESDATSSRIGIRGDRLSHSLNTSRFDANGNIVCGDGTDGCVPIDMFAASLYPVGTVIGDFATAAERDYLFDSRDFRTTYKQTIISAYTTGYLGNLPGGTITAGFGFEFRNDKIDSIPDDVARDGLFFGFFSDGGAVGEKDTTEFFGEIELPLHETLTVNLSARWTDDEFYGSDTTYSGKIGWRVTPSLLIRGTYGTSFRAPNLREVFLMDQTGFLNINDPCVIPEVARDPFSGGYNPDLDPRETHVLQNCLNNGVDPTTLDNNGFTVFSTEIARGGQQDIDAETSASLTFGFSFEQPWFDTFDLDIGLSYYSLDISNTIIEPSAQFLVNDCYFDEELDSSFCGTIVRGPDGFFDIINAKFLNRDEAKNRGVDINVNYEKTFQIGSRAVDLGVDLIMNHSIEASDTFISDDGDVDFDEDDSEFGFPDWKGQLGVRANIGDWRVTWVTRYISSVDQDVDGLDAFDEAITGFSDTCVGPPTDVLCRDVGFADNYWMHSTSVYYFGDTWTFGAGVRNVFDEDPPLVDGTEVLSFNAPFGYGYDLNGREYFLNIVWRPTFGSN